MILRNGIYISTMKLVSKEKSELTFHVYEEQFHLFYRLKLPVFKDGSIPFEVSISGNNPKFRVYDIKNGT